MEGAKHQLNNGDLNYLETGKLNLARAALARAEKNTKRRWNNGWKRPKWLKAGHQFNEAAFLFCQANEKQHGRDALLSAYQCFKQKRAWYYAAKTLEQVVALNLSLIHI